MKTAPTAANQGHVTDRLEASGPIEPTRGVLGPNLVERSLVKRFNIKPEAVIGTAPEPANHATDGQPDLLRRKHARNKSNSMRNWSKVEQYLTEVEKAHGLSKAWALRERLERGHVTLDELMRR